MKHIDCWLDALPPEAPERELLTAAERDVPPPGSVDRSWTVLCAAAAITSGTVAISSSAAAAASSTVTGSVAASVSPAATSVAASALPAVGAVLASGAAASATTSVGLVGWSVAAKSIAVGFAIGVGALGTGQLVQSIHRREPVPLASYTEASRNAPHSEASRHASRLRNAVHTDPKHVSAAPNEAAHANQPGFANEPVKRDHDVAPTSVVGLVGQDSNIASADVKSVDVKNANSAKSSSGRSADNADGRSADSKGDRTSSPQQQGDDVARKQSGVPSQVAEMPLSQQAAELARIKGLLDSGAPSEALVRLRACLDAHALSAIAEDRDALYIEALMRTGRHAEARRAASHFYAHYPNSPQRDRIGELVSVE